MITNTFYLSEGQYIADIEPFKSSGIPTNSIIHKKIPGCGITRFEIQFAQHHSIIILPNVPVIKSKVAKHNKDFPEKEILGVHKGVDVEDIEYYLAKDIEFKKVLTTPEGFIKKVIAAFANSVYVMKKDFFLLYDECERIITDVNYRGDIAAPLDIFHSFDNKALVSATPLAFSDEALTKFEHYYVEPLYDYSQPLTVINTNNVLASTSAYLDKIQSKQVFIFLNSSNGIAALINHKDIGKNSKVYCGEESVMKLSRKGIKNVSDDCALGNLLDHTFLTSRYFSAFDIELDYLPDIILVSDIFFAHHSILDPHTDVIQIAGRFRNGINSITHITSFNKFMEVKTQEEAKTYLDGCLDTYEHVVDLFKTAKTKGSAETLEFFVKNSPIAPFFTNGKRNRFMIDNDLNQERVKGYYTNLAQLQLAYGDVIGHFKTSYQTDSFNVGDDDFFTLKNAETKREKYEQVATLLERYTNRSDKYVLMTERTMQQKNWLTNKFPVIADAITWLGLSQTLRVGFDSKELKKAIKEAQKLDQILKIFDDIQTSFAEDSIVKETELLDTLNDIYIAHNLTLKPYAKHILRYFNGRRTQQYGVNVYVLNYRLDRDSIHNMFKS